MGKGGMAGMLFQITELEKTPPLKQMPLELGLNNQHQTCKDLKEELSRKRKQGTGLRQEWSDIKHSGWSVWASHSSHSQEADFIQIVWAKDVGFKWGQSSGNKECV